MRVCSIVLLYQEKPPCATRLRHGNPLRGASPLHGTHIASEAPHHGMGLVLRCSNNVRVLETLSPAQTPCSPPRQTGEVIAVRSTRGPALRRSVAMPESLYGAYHDAVYRVRGTRVALEAIVRRFWEMRLHRWTFRQRKTPVWWGWQPPTSLPWQRGRDGSS
jgi:hypothetical protein